MILTYLYIPLCFLLIQDFISLRISAIFLYIPLCFLLIGLPISNLSDGEKPLHSTMFSINLETLDDNNMAMYPLHSTMFSINRRKHCPVVYRRKTLHSTMFSINLYTYSLCEFHPPVFTFHYVFY